MMKVYISYSRNDPASVDLILALIACLEEKNSRFIPSSYVKKNGVDGVMPLAAPPGETAWVPEAYEIRAHSHFPG